jgi:hypothetical protein
MQRSLQHRRTPHARRLLWELAETHSQRRIQRTKLAQVATACGCHLSLAACQPREIVRS